MQRAVPSGGRRGLVPRYYLTSSSWHRERRDKKEEEEEEGLGAIRPTTSRHVPVEWPVLDILILFEAGS